MNRGGSPILNRTLAEALRSHPHPDALHRLLRFVDQVLLPRGSVVGVLLSCDLSVRPRLELISIVDSSDARPPCAFPLDGGTPADLEHVEIELRWWSRERLARQSWPEGVKYALAQGVLLCDPDGSLYDLLEQRLWYPEALRRHRLLDNTIKIQQLLGDGGVQAWVRRRNYLQAHHLITTALNRTIDHLFDFHQVWRPPPARRLSAVEALDWRPTGFDHLLETAMKIPALDDEVLAERSSAVERLFEAIQARLVSESWWPKEPYQQWHATLGQL